MAKQHSQFSPSGSTFLPCLGLPSNSHRENSIFSIFLESPHQVDMKNIVKCYKHFFGYFNSLKTHGGQHLRKSHFNFGGKFEFRSQLSYYSCNRWENNKQDRKELCILAWVCSHMGNSNNLVKKSKVLLLYRFWQKRR